MLGRNTVKFTHMSFGLVPEVLDPIDMIASIGKEFRVINAVVFKVWNIQDIVPCPAVAIDDAIGFDFVFHDGHERLTFGIRNDLCVNPAATFEDTENWNFTRCATSTPAFSYTAKITFIDFKLSWKQSLIFDLKGNNSPQTMEIIGRRFAVNIH